MTWHFSKKFPASAGNKDLSLRSSPGCTQICRGCVLHLYTTLIAMAFIFITLIAVENSICARVKPHNESMYEGYDESEGNPAQHTFDNYYFTIVSSIWVVINLVFYWLSTTDQLRSDWDVLEEGDVTRDLHSRACVDSEDEYVRLSRLTTLPPTVCVQTVKR